MKILLLTDRMESGGAETHVCQLAHDLRARGHEVLLWSSGGRLAKQMEQKGFPCILQPPPSHSPFVFLCAKIKLIRLVKKQKIEVLHAHTRLTAQLIRGMKRKGCAEVVTVHARFRSGAFLSRVSYWGRSTIAVSEDLRAYTKTCYRLPAERIEVIPNGIDCRRFAPKTRSHAGIRLFFASRLDADCSLGAFLLCRLAPVLCARYPFLSISIAGGGTRLAALRTEADKANEKIGRNAVVLLGHADDMPALLAEHDIFVGVSRAAMEAAACGCAVVLCGNEGYLGILNKESAPFALLSNFCARGEEEAAEERLQNDLCALIDSEELRLRVAAEGMKFVRDHLDSAVLCHQTENVYRKTIPQKSGIPIALGGYFGCGNLGDDAILQGILHELKARHPTIRPAVFSGTPRYDRKRLGTKTVHRKNPGSIFGGIFRSHLFLLGGGSLLQNRTGNLSLAYYLGLLKTARVFRTEAALFASGIGPLLGDRATDRVRNALRSVSHVGLRDPQSKSLLRSIGVPPEKLTVGADACFLLPMPPPTRALFLRKEAKIPFSSRLLGIVLRKGRKDSNLFSVLSAVAAVCHTHALIPVFFVLDRKQDLTLSQRTATLFQSLGTACIVPDTPADALAWFASCRAVLSMRLHGMLLAARAATPSLGICTDGSDQKMVAFGAQSGQPVFDLSSLSETEAASALGALITAAEDRRLRLQALASEMQKNAKKDLAKLLQIVYNKR